MKIIYLTNSQKQVLVDDEDYVRLCRYAWHLDAKGYVKRNLGVADGRHGTVHIARQLLNLTDGSVVDHINGNPLDNRRMNLRSVTRAQNNRNRRMNVRNRSGYKGVAWHYGKWRAIISKDGRNTHLGVFDNPQRAAVAYNEAAQKQYGRFARLNILSNEPKKE